MNTNSQIMQYFQRLREDFPFYCSQNIRIKDKAARLCMFIFNRMQQRLWEFYQEDIKAGRSIDWFVIKGRQMGSTLFFTVLFYWLTSLWPNRNAAVIAQDEKAGHALGAKIQNYYQRSDDMLRPSVRIMNREQIHFATSLEEFKKTGDIGLDCHLDTFSIDTKNLGRSYTFQYLLLTEFSMYESVVQDVSDRLDSIFNTMGDSAGNVRIRETTPKGEGYAKEVWEDSENGVRKIFISWVSMDDYRISLSINDYFELSESDAPESRYGDELTEREKIIKELKIWWPEINTETEIEHEVMCRLAWRRRKIDKDCSGKKVKFRQEYPTSIEDAFTYSSESIFPLDRIVEYENYLNENKVPSTKWIYFHDNTITDKTRKFYQDKAGKLTIYEPPKPNLVYVIGADGAEGIPGRDESSAYVLKLPELVEVACFSDIIIPSEFAGVLNYLGLLYNDALLGCELNDKGGFAALDRLVNDYHYPHLYYQINPLKSKVETNIRWGWKTDFNTRQNMIDAFTVLIEEGNILIRSKKLLTQMKSFVIINGKAQASAGKHDDLVIAAMIAVQMSRQAHIPQQAIVPQKAPKWSVDWHLQRMQLKQDQRQTFRRR